MHLFRMDWQYLLILIIACSTFGACLQPVFAQESHESDALTRESRIPLDEGHLDVGELLGTLLDELGLDGQTARQNINWRINVHSTLGGQPVKLIEAATSDVVQIEITDDALVLIWDELEMQRERERIRRDVQALIARWFPDAVDALDGAYGFRVFTKERGHVPFRDVAFTDAGDLADQPCVVLVHGLNEPGEIWNALKPRLLDSGYVVAEFWYPNDQSVPDSSTFFAREMRKMKSKGLDRTSIVAHSMGGLVVRNVLNDPARYNGSGDGGEDLPTIDRFIMVGTPNHGAPLAALAIGSEIREQITRSLSGNGSVFGGFFDGAGEAQQDLEPASEFLTGLNARPVPGDVQITIIAGKASPLHRAEIEAMRDRWSSMMTNGTEELVDSLASGLIQLSEDVGDGCVSVESTRLEGVPDHIIVEGNHLTMLRHLSYHDDARVPPAVDIILKRLGKAPARDE